jgi:hypothetical protein
MKTTSSFKFPRHYKYLLATITDKHQRGVYKRSLIQATLYAQEQERRVGKGDRANHNDE